jgi:UDP-N-acetylglucosamine:LPS N-acetylglucosamine transferase
MVFQTENTKSIESELSLSDQTESGLSSKQKILIVTCKKLGAGHYSVAKSLEKYLSAKEDVEVFLFNWNWIGGETYELILSSLPKVLKVSHRFMDSQTVQDFSKGLSHHILRKYTSKPLEYFDKIIITIPSAQFMGYTDALSSKTYVVVTDYGKIYKPWGTYRPRMFFVCDDTTAKDLQQNQYTANSQVVISSIPVNEKINEVRKLDKLTVRKELGVTSKNYYVLVLGGGGDKRLISLIENMLKEDLTDKSFLIVCGRNERAYEHVQQIVAKHGGNNINVVGFIPNDELIKHYRASDIVISKPGGITTTELVNLRTPIAMPFVYPVEIGNRDFLISHKAGIYHPDLDTFFKVVFNQTEAELQMYSDNMNALAKLNSAEVICETVINDRIH